MPGRNKQGGKGCPKLKRIGSRRARIAAYYLNVYPQRKLRRILRCGTHNEARSWADRHMCRGLLDKLVAQRGGAL